MRQFLTSVAIALLMIGVAVADDTDPGDVSVYALYKNNPTITVNTATTNLREYLTNHITTFITQTRWAPYYEWFHVDAHFRALSMTEPADVFYALSLAYPYLAGTESTGLKGDVRTYLRARWSDSGSQPYAVVDYSTLRPTTNKRNWHRVDMTDSLNYGIATNPIEQYSSTSRRINLYAIYLFAQNTNSWDLITGSLYSTYIRPVYTTYLSSYTSSSVDDANSGRNISSVIGYARIAHYMWQNIGGSTYEADYNAAIAKLSTMLQTRLTQQIAEGGDCNTYIDEVCVKDSTYWYTQVYGAGYLGGCSQFRSYCSSPLDGCLYAGREEATNGCAGSYVPCASQGFIGQYVGFTPEVGRALRDNTPTASGQIASWAKRNAQTFQLVNFDTSVQMGEIPKNDYFTHMSFFHLMSDVQASNFDTHFQLVDVPAGNADVFYIERLVRAIEASGSQNWVTYTTATSWPTEIDTTPPIITNPLPVGSQLCTSNPRNITISIATDENATCKYNITDVAYDSMANFFAPTGTTSHSSVISLACSASYVYYCRCSDATGNKNSTSSLISFLMAAPSGGTVGGLIMGGVTR